MADTDQRGIMKISTSGLTARIRTAISNSDTDKSLVRSIDEDWARDIADAVRATLKRRTDADVEACVRVCGGFVANAYGYRPMADWMFVHVDLTSGAITVGNVTRASGCNRRFGRGNSIIGRLLKSGQTQGRVVF